MGYCRKLYYDAFSRFYDAFIAFHSKDRQEILCDFLVKRAEVPEGALVLMPVGLRDTL